MKKAEYLYKYLLLLGGNLGDVVDTINRAVDHLRMLGNVSQISDVYCSEAWGFESDNVFFNQVVELTTSLTPLQVLGETQSIEILLGRTQKSSDGVYHSRMIDIDLLFCHELSLKDGREGDVLIDSPRLTLPHKMIHRRRFTLVPLVERWPSMRHPLMKKSMQELLQECDDSGKVWRR